MDTYTVGGRTLVFAGSYGFRGYPSGIRKQGPLGPRTYNSYGISKTLCLPCDPSLSHVYLHFSCVSGACKTRCLGEHIPVKAFRSNMFNRNWPVLFSPSDILLEALGIWM